MPLRSRLLATRCAVKQRRHLCHGEPAMAFTRMATSSICAAMRWPHVGRLPAKASSTRILMYLQDGSVKGPASPTATPAAPCPRPRRLPRPHHSVGDVLIAGLAADA